MAEILPNSPNDVASRGVTNTTLTQFKGLARQVVINVDDGFRPVIMDGLTLGGKFFCASKAEVEAVKTTANNALTKTQADGYYLGKSAKAVSAGSADTATSAGKWTTARTLTLAGGATGSTSIDGSTNVTLNVTSIAGAKVTGTVPSATTAISASTATKATQDASGNVITSTYATKSELTSGLATKQPVGDYRTKSELDKIYLGINAKAKSATTADTATSANSVNWNNVQGKPSIKTGVLRTSGSVITIDAEETWTAPQDVLCDISTRATSSAATYVLALNGTTLASSYLEAHKLGPAALIFMPKGYTLTYKATYFGGDILGNAYPYTMG